MILQYDVNFFWFFVDVELNRKSAAINEIKRRFLKRMTLRWYIYSKSHRKKFSRNKTLKRTVSLQCAMKISSDYNTFCNENKTYLVTSPFIKNWSSHQQTFF